MTISKVWEKRSLIFQCVERKNAPSRCEFQTWEKHCPICYTVLPLLGSRFFWRIPKHVRKARSTPSQAQGVEKELWPFSKRELFPLVIIYRYAFGEALRGIPPNRKAQRLESICETLKVISVVWPYQPLIRSANSPRRRDRSKATSVHSNHTPMLSGFGRQS